MTVRRWSYPVLILGLLGCEDDPEPRLFGEIRSYEHALFATPEECAAAQPPDSFFNCDQTATFYTDGTAELMVTDIQNVGSYGITDGVVLISFSGPSEVGQRWRFEIVDDSTLVDAAGNEWTIEDSGAD